jgi:hypothetical protein
MLDDAPSTIPQHGRAVDIGTVTQRRSEPASSGDDGGLSTAILIPAATMTVVLVKMRRSVQARGRILSKWRDAELLDILSRRWDVHILILFRR